MYSAFCLIDFLNFVFGLFFYEWAMCSLEKLHLKISIVIIQEKLHCIYKHEKDIYIA